MRRRGTRVSPQAELTLLLPYVIATKRCSCIHSAPAIRMTNSPRLATSSSANSVFAKARLSLSKSVRRTHRLRTDCPRKDEFGAAHALRSPIACDTGHRQAFESYDNAGGADLLPVAVDSGTRVQ
jgi:hypothetical protein